MIQAGLCVSFRYLDAVKNPNTSLQTTVDDWIESYQNDEGKAMAELINFVLRVRLAPCIRKSAYTLLTPPLPYFSHADVTRQ